jgi:hypothetical protein
MTITKDERILAQRDRLYAALKAVQQTVHQGRGLTNAQMGVIDALLDEIEDARIKSARNQ